MIYIENYGTPVLLTRLTDEDIANPYKVISNYFSWSALPAQRTHIRQITAASIKDGHWSKGHPRTLIHVGERLEKLIEALYLIQREDDKVTSNPSIVNPDEVKKDVVNPELYCGWSEMFFPWDYFPRHLTREEYINPYKALRKFFKYKSLPEWKGLIKELMDCALSPHSVYDLGSYFNVLKISSMLQKIVEAAHLIEVRELMKLTGKKRTIYMDTIEPETEETENEQ